MLTFPPVQSEGHHGSGFPAEHAFSHAQRLKSGLNESFGLVRRESALRSDDAERASRKTETGFRHEALSGQTAFQQHLSVLEGFRGSNELVHAAGQGAQFRQPGIPTLLGARYKRSVPVFPGVLRNGKLTALCLPEPQSPPLRAPPTFPVSSRVWLPCPSLRPKLRRKKDADILWS